MVIVCPAHYIGTGKGYKHEIWQEDVVSDCKEEFKYENKKFTSSLSKGNFESAI